MAKNMGRLVRKNKEHQWVIQRQENGGLVYWVGEGVWSDHPLAAKLYKAMPPFKEDMPAGEPDKDFKVVQIS